MRPKTFGPDVTSWSSTGLSTGTTYYCRVQAFVVVGGQTTYSAYSPIASAIDPVEPLPQPTDEPHRIRPLRDPGLAQVARQGEQRNRLPGATGALLLGPLEPHRHDGDEQGHLKSPAASAVPNVSRRPPSWGAAVARLT